MFLKKKVTVIFALFFCLLAQSQTALVSGVEFIGNKRTKSTALKKVIHTKVNGKFDKQQIELDKKRLIRLPAIANVDYKIEKGTAGYNVFFTVEENFTLIPGANVYTTDEDEFAFRLSLFEFNLFGQNITAGGWYQRDIYDSFGASFKAPFLFSNKLGLALNYSNLTTQEPVFLDNGTAQYKYNNTSYEVLGLYQFNFFNRIELGVNFFNEDYLFKSKEGVGELPDDVPTDFNVDKLLYKLVYEYNDLAFHFYFVSGFKSLLNFQYVRSSDGVLPSFIIGWNDFTYYKRIRENGNWATRLRMGLATNSDSPFAPFAVDNNINVRGVGNTIDRGTGVIVLNTEYRHTLYEKKSFVLQSNVFLDAGSWRNPQGDFSDFTDSDNFRIYPGAGIRFIHKKIFNAIFRIDYGYGISKDATSGFVFGIGQYF
ncbi:POTRA domain-containing protein [Aquimarina agarivorans]|uniref:POTRA domain-containing protein n=1 Tax=Aquimarina agarivorans TaxID=980584 RepID=UPI000248E916|nr:POTRA domain-containing protein [Aquimarina agarivorans]